MIMDLSQFHPRLEHCPKFLQWYLDVPCLPGLGSHKVSSLAFQVRSNLVQISAAYPNHVAEPKTAVRFPALGSSVAAQNNQAWTLS